MLELHNCRNISVTLIDGLTSADAFHFPPFAFKPGTIHFLLLRKRQRRRMIGSLW